MEHTKAQKRMLICAAFLSLGALGGVLTFSRLSQTALEKICDWIYRFLIADPLPQLPLVSLILPLLLLLSGASAFGAGMILCLCLMSGFVFGALEASAFRLHFLPLVTGAFFLLESVCILQIGICMLRRASMVYAQVGQGQFKPDYRFDRASVISAFSVLLVAAFVFAYYLLNI